MKKYIKIMTVAIAVSFLVPLSVVHSQIAGLDIKLGVKGGFNYSLFGGKDNDQTKGKTGYNVGVFALYELMPMIAVQPELLYTLKGARTTTPGQNFEYYYQYFEMPVLMRVGMDIEEQKFYFIGGPSFSYAKKAYTRDREGSATVLTKPKKSDYGIIAGLGTGTADSKITVEGRIYFGVPDVVKKTKVNNITYSIGMGYLIY
ncbi:MAG TPA: porin family protein [bacterium]|nr:porin family protein [bacterium]HMW33239.1 porin family protein [bacterium]HMW35074.1 porin family protein [bacterium]HMY34989.1 porin family protein [bacterium]HMZ03625.1 porin family protein [bacterium]